MANRMVVALVHGWSVINTDTYGALPEQLVARAAAAGVTLERRDVFLGRYVSFDDAVTMADLTRALEAAVQREIVPTLAKNERFAMITHSTGGPLAREWWRRFHNGSSANCPASHLVMLAPANFGSALAQLGKSRISRLKSWAQDVEPGVGVLNWLELGSPEAWSLNLDWTNKRIRSSENAPVYPFVLTGQSIDRSLYDYLNTYTAEMGSDGVVRAAAANLNSRYVLLRQQYVGGRLTKKPWPLELRANRINAAPNTPFRLIQGAAHSGEARGIMRSLQAGTPDTGLDTTEQVWRCLTVQSMEAYRELNKVFTEETARIVEHERVEIEAVRLLPDREHIHDPCAMLVVRVVDTEGFPVTDFDLLFTDHTGNPDGLPRGFLVDRQQNRRAPNHLTFFFNHAALTGAPAVADPRNPARELRPALTGLKGLGIRITARPDNGFVFYMPAEYIAEQRSMLDALRPHETTLLEIVLQRLVDGSVAAFDKATAPRRSFKDVKLSGPIDEDAAAGS